MTKALLHRYMPVLVVLAAIAISIATGGFSDGN